MPRRLFLAVACVVLVGGASSERSSISASEGGRAKVPAVWGTPLGLEGGAALEARKDLGRHLFYEPQLSGNGCMSCATCHQQTLAFTDGQRRARGATGEEHPRNTPTLTNVAYHPSYTWIDVGVETLEQQALTPMFHDLPIEMGLESAELLMSRLVDDSAYRARFAAAYPTQESPVSLDNLLSAIATFERQLLSANSPFDRLVYAGDVEAMSDAGRRGMDLFFSHRLGCVRCHSGFNFSGPVRTEEAPNTAPAFMSTGLQSAEEAASPFSPTRFKIPTLRNVAVTAPYMHDGSLDTLEDVIRHYETGGGDHAHRSALLRPFSLTDKERQELIAFLEHLTDETFLTAKQFSDPKPDRHLPEHCKLATTAPTPRPLAASAP